MNDTQLISNHFSPIYFEGGLLIIGRTGTGKTTFLIQSLEELRERKDYRVTMNPDILTALKCGDKKLAGPSTPHLTDATVDDLKQGPANFSSWASLPSSTLMSRH